jgi:hypothetical protein
MLASTQFDHNERLDQAQAAQAPDPVPWPRLLTPPAEAMAWLHRHHAALLRLDETAAAVLSTLHYLVLAELDQTAPAAPERGPPGAGPVTLTRPVV